MILCGIKNCTLLTGTITLQNYAILSQLWWFLAYRCTWEYPIACLFDSLCKIENWEPAYHISYCLFSSRPRRKMWNSCCNARPQTLLLQTYGLLTVLTLILWIPMKIPMKVCTGISQNLATPLIESRTNWLDSLHCLPLGMGSTFGQNLW